MLTQLFEELRVVVVADVDEGSAEDGVGAAAAAAVLPSHEVEMHPDCQEVRDNMNELNCHDRPKECKIRLQLPSWVTIVFIVHKRLFDEG